jgi:predicted MFS family arabinose efflux permease
MTLDLARVREAHTAHVATAGYGREHLHHASTDSRPAGRTPVTTEPRVLRGGPVLVVSTLTIGLGSVPGFLFGFLGPVLEGDLGISKPALGVLVGVFFGATGLGSVVGGTLAERLGAHRAVALDMATVAASMLLAVLVPTYPALLVAAIVSGAGYALANAGTNMAVAVSTPPARHGIAMAVKTAGVPAIGALQSLLAVGAAAAFGWRPVLAVTIPVLVVAGLLALRFLPAARSAGAVPGAHALGHAPPAARLPAGFGWFPVAAFLMIAGTQPLYAWAVPSLHESGGVPLATAGALSSIGSAVAVVAMILMAGRTDRLGGNRVTPVAVLCAATALGIVVLLLGVVAGPVAMTAGLIVASVCQLTAIGLMHAAVVATAPHLVGRASGVTMSGYYLGALLSAPVFGLVVEQTGGYGVGWALGAVLTVAAALCFLRCRRIGR